MNELAAAIVLTLGAVHVEACVPLLIQCATARPDAPAALLVLAYTQTIIASVDRVCATRRALTTRHAAVVQAVRDMEVASGRNGKAVARLCAPSYPFIAWFFIVSYAVAFMHCNTCISILMLCYVYLPATVVDLLATLRASFDAVYDVPSSFDSLATPVLRALLSVMSPTPADDMETSSVTSDSDESSDSCDESLNSEADDASDSEVMGDCLPDLFERVGNFIFGAARERTPEVCKELALRRRRQDPRPDIARPSPEYLLELKEEEAWQQLQQQRAAARRRRARFSHMLLSSPPMPYQLGYIAFPLPDPPCSDPVAPAPQAQPVQPPQATSFTQQPIAQGFTFVKPATFSAWSNNLPNQTFSSFTSASSPFAASASAFGFNKTSTTSTYQNVASPPTASDTPAQAGQAFSFVDPATYTPPPNNPFAAYASASSPFATSASAFGFNKTSTPPPVQNGTTPPDVGGFQPSANQPSPSNGPFQFVDPAVWQAMNQPTAQNPATVQRNEEGYEVIDEKSYYAAPAPAQPAPEQPTPAQTNANVLRDEEGYEIINENAYYATNVTENPASSTPTVQNVTTPASAAFALPSTPPPANTISAITAPAPSIQNHTPVHNYSIAEPVRRTSPFTPTTLNAQVHIPEALPNHISPAVSTRARSSPLLSTSALFPSSPAEKIATPTPSIPTQAEPSPSTPVNVATMAHPASPAVPSNTTAATTVPTSPISLPSLVFSAPLVLSPPTPGRRSTAPSPPSLSEITTANQVVMCERDGHGRQPLGSCTQCKIVADGKKPKKVVFHDPLENEIAQTLGSGARDNARAMPDMSDDEDGSAPMSVLDATGAKPRKVSLPKRDFQHADAATLGQRKLRALPKTRTATNTNQPPAAPALSAASSNAAQDAAALASQSCVQAGPSTSASAAPVSASTTTAPSVSPAATEESDEGDNTELDLELDELLGKIPDRPVSDDAVVNINNWGPASG